jgi:CRP-like cAMP-binding protein
MHISINSNLTTYFESLSEEDMRRLISSLEKKSFPAGHRLLEEGHICRYLYFLEKGLVRCYTTDERTLWYEFEGSAFTCLESFYSQRTAKECISLMEDSLLLCISYQQLMSLFEQSHGLAKWGIQFHQKELSRIEQYYKQLLYKDATTRYEELIAARPDILQRIPLHHIASYLGITGVSLSRIRAGKQRKRI